MHVFFYMLNVGVYLKYYSDVCVYMLCPVWPEAMIYSCPTSFFLFCPSAYFAAVFSLAAPEWIP